MYTRHQPQRNRPSNRLRDLPLIHRPQPRATAMPYPSHLRHIFAHDAEILVQVQRIEVQGVERVGRRTVSPAPLSRFRGTEVVWCVSFASAPVAAVEALDRPGLLFACDVRAEFLPLRHGDGACLGEGSAWDILG